MTTFRKLTRSFHRQQQLRMEKVLATQRHIEEFREQQAEWRRMERERMEEENQRIMEYACHQQQREEDKMAKVRVQEEEKQNLQKMVRKYQLIISGSVRWCIQQKCCFSGQ